MPGGSVAHAALSAAAIRTLGAAIPEECMVFSSDLEVRVEATDLSTFPDVSVVCGPVATSPRDRHALVNPSVLVEVTSRSTEDYDRSEKLSHYKQLPSVRAVVFISHRERRITVVQRAATGWAESEHRAGEEVELTSPACRFPVDAIYAGVELEPR